MAKKKASTAVVSSEMVRQPDNLYLQWHGDAEPTDSPISVMDVTWSRDKIWPYDIEYARVPNDAFIAPLMRWLVQREGKCAATTAPDGFAAPTTRQLLNVPAHRLEASK